MEYDVIVVGSGPAGSATAKAAAEKGARVLVIDKRMEIGSPVQCGEAFGKVGMGAYNMKPSKKWVAQELDTACLITPDGTTISYKNQAYILERRIFDKHLAIDAARAGAEYRVNTLVTGLTKEKSRITGVKTESNGHKEEFKGKVVVGADGLESNIGRSAGLSRPMSLKYTASGIQYELVNVDLDDAKTEFIYFGSRAAPRGYAWIFPKGDDVANVGMGMTMERNETWTAKKYLDRFISENHMTKRATPVNMVAGGIPVCNPLERTVKDNVMVVGDAARQINSMAGAGIGYSLLCGQIAGRVAGSATSKGNITEDDLMEYDRAWRDKYGVDLEMAFRLKEILVDITDEEFNDLAKTINGIGVDNLTGMNFSTMIFEIIMKANPAFIEKMEGFL